MLAIISYWCVKNEQLVFPSLFCNHYRKVLSRRRRYFAELSLHPMRIPSRVLIRPLLWSTLKANKKIPPSSWKTRPTDLEWAARVLSNKYGVYGGPRPFWVWTSMVSVCMTSYFWGSLGAWNVNVGCWIQNFRYEIKNLPGSLAVIPSAPPAVHGRI